jgi:tetratricopeptide (TPR) repeat protein
MKNDKLKNLTTNHTNFLHSIFSLFVNVSVVRGKKFVFITILFLFASSLFAQQQAMSPWWLSLEQGKVKFQNGDYGLALLLFEDARRARRAMYEQMERDLILFLSVNEVRRLGDSLEYVERFARERYYNAAYAALQELYYRVPKKSLNNSATAALEAIGKLKDYPEAEYWIGEVYRVEGELPLALSQFRKVYTMREYLEDQGFSLELSYKIASILLTRQDYNEMIRVYNSIINEYDTLWVNANQAEVTRTQQAALDERHRTPVPYVQESASFASRSMSRILENEGIVRFLELYRYNNPLVEKAHRQLGFFYAVTRRPLAEQHLMYAFLIQNTVIIEEVRRHIFDYRFTSLDDLARQINVNPLLLSYIEEVEYYKTVYYFGASLYMNGKTPAARNLWTFLSTQDKAGEWQNRAISQLRSPRHEPVVEMP